MADDDASLLCDVRRGDAAAWERLIARYEGRLMAFVESRLNDRAAAEDVVQETFLGFLTSLPNYDEQTPLEAFLFAIAAHKLMDVLRRTGRRPALALVLRDDSSRGNDSHSGHIEHREPVGRERKASSMARSAEQHIVEERILGNCLRGLIQAWYSRGEFERLQCIELLFVLGWSNKDVAARLGLSEQAVANHKSFVIGKLKEAAAAARLRDVNWSDRAGDTVPPG
jgi:RNA polymerase sigma-70 factor (ECF subfamily)